MRLWVVQREGEERYHGVGVRADGGGMWGCEGAERDMWMEEKDYTGYSKKQMYSI